MECSLLTAWLNQWFRSFQSLGYNDSFGVCQSYSLASCSIGGASPGLPMQEPKYHSTALCRSLKWLALQPLTNCDKTWRKTMNQMHDKDLPGTDDRVSGDRHIGWECVITVTLISTFLSKCAFLFSIFFTPSSRLCFRQVFSVCLSVI